MYFFRVLTNPRYSLLLSGKVNYFRLVDDIHSKNSSGLRGAFFHADEYINAQLIVVNRKIGAPNVLKNEFSRASSLDSLLEKLIFHRKRLDPRTPLTFVKSRRRFDCCQVGDAASWSCARR